MTDLKVQMTPYSINRHNFHQHLLASQHHPVMLHSHPHLHHNHLHMLHNQCHTRLHLSHLLMLHNHLHRLHNQCHLHIPPHFTSTPTSAALPMPFWSPASPVSVPLDLENVIKRKFGENSIYLGDTWKGVINACSGLNSTQTS